MEMSSDRIKGFSDACIAIIITLMILEIPLPAVMNRAELLEFFKSLLVYAASFAIVGGQWNRHHRLIDRMEKVSNHFVWLNMVYLFVLSLVPLFMKWVIGFPFSVIPALGYSVVYLLNELVMRILFFTLLKENRKSSLNSRMEAGRERFSWKHLFLLTAAVGLILGLSFVLPEISIVCFIILPMAMSLKNLMPSEPLEQDLRRIPCGREKMAALTRRKLARPLKK